MEEADAATGIYLQTTPAAQDGGWFGFEFCLCPVLAYMLSFAFSAFSLVKSFHGLKYSCFSSSRAVAAPLPCGCCSSCSIWA